MTPLHLPSHEQVPQKFNTLMSRVLGATALMPNKLMTTAIYLLRLFRVNFNATRISYILTIIIVNITVTAITAFIC